MLIRGTGIQAAPASTPVGWERIDIGAGGYLRGIDNSPDNLTLVCRTDVFGAYIAASTTGPWQQLNTTDRFPGITSLANGVIELRPAPSNSSILYGLFCDASNNCNLFKSINRAATFTQQTNFATFTANPNTENDNYSNCGFGKKLAIDPNNANAALFGTSTTGVIETTDGGTTFATMSGITASLTAGAVGYAMEIDGNSGTTGGRSNVSYIFSQGTGLYQRTTPTGSWNLLNSGTYPTTCCHFTIGPDSTVWLVDTSGYFWSYASSTWTKFTNVGTGHSGNEGLWTVKVNTNGDLYVAYPSGRLGYSNNGGVSWVYGFTAATTLIATDIPYLTTTGTYLTVGDLAISGSNLLMSAGVGVWTTPLPTSTPFNLTSQSLGIEELVTNRVIQPPNFNGVVLGCWDRDYFVSAPPYTIFPSEYFPTNVFCAAWDLDWCTSDGATVIANCNWAGLDQTSILTGGGTSAALCAALPMEPTLTTTAATSAGNVLTFGGGVPAYIFPGMRLYDNTNNAAFSLYTVVLSTTSTTVTIGNTDNAGGTNVLSTVAIGDQIAFFTGNGGCVAAASPTNFIVCASDTCIAAQYTKDGGNTWATLQFPGVPSTFNGNFINGLPTVSGVTNISKLQAGWPIRAADGLSTIPGGTTILSINVGASSLIMSNNAGATATGALCTINQNYLNFLYGINYYDLWRPFCADRVTPNCFYYLCPLTGQLYQSTNSGDTWAAVNVTPANISTTYGNGGFGGGLFSVPNNAGHIFFVGVGTTLLRTTNGGVTFSSLSGVVASSIAFGAPKPGGGGYPTVIVSGTVSGVQGIWRSVDDCVSWQQIGPTLPFNSFDSNTCVEAHKTTYGIYYLGFGGFGWLWGYFP